MEQVLVYESFIGDIQVNSNTRINMKGSMKVYIRRYMWEIIRLK